MAQFDRIYKYKLMFKRNRLLTKQAILKELEISEATFKRDLDKMRDFYHYHIDYDRFENAYKLINPDDSYELPGLMFTQKELLASNSFWVNINPGSSYESSGLINL